MNTSLRAVLHIISAFCFIFVTALGLLPQVSMVQAAPVRTHGGVNGSQGYYYLRTEDGGNGNLNPGQQVTVDSYFFQCRQAGTAACSTEHNSDAVRIEPVRHDSITVPNLNQQTQTFYHSYTPPYGNCGRVQFDNGIVGIPGAVGGWVHNFGVNCPDNQPTPTPQPTSNPGSCNDQLPINTQFRKSGDNSRPWIDGNALTASGLKPGDQIDVNCFAKNGGALLQNARIDITLPNGSTSQGLQQPEIRNYYLGEAGNYRFRCYIAGQSGICTNTDSFTVRANVTPTPTPTPTTNPTPTPPNQVSQCEELVVVSGNDSWVPAKVRFRARGSDNKGAIQRYRFYFGDGKQEETTNTEIEHTYEVSGTFIARADIKDSVGNWKSSSSCEKTVYVKSAPIESHKSGCSDIFININNNAQAPATASFKVTGYDNKGTIQGYKIDFGNGITKEGTGQTFEQSYDQAGTYTVRAYVKDSQGNYQTNDDSCKRTVYINTKPLTRQPETGTPTVFTVLGVVSGLGGIALTLAKKKLVA